MKKLLMLALCLPMVACVADIDDGDAGGGGGGGGTGSGSGSNTGNPGDVSGSIKQSATWSGTMTFKGPATIESGVTITVAAGTTLAFVGSNSLTIKGTLDIQGTAAAKVNIKPQSGTYFGGLINSGTLKMNFAVQKGAGVYTQSGSTTTITDSLLSHSLGDLIVMNGGDLTATYSQIGARTGDSTHCQLHFSSAGKVSITKSNIFGAPYGFMFYSGSNGVYTDNNWIGNGIHIDRTSGATGTFDRGYFDGNLATKVTGGVTISDPAAAELTNVGVGAPR